MRPLWMVRSGRFAGWIRDDLLFNADGIHVGYFKGDTAFGLHGRYIGEIIRDHWFGRRSFIHRVSGHRPQEPPIVCNPHGPRGPLRLPGWLDADC